MPRRMPVYQEAYQRFTRLNNLLQSTPPSSIVGVGFAYQMTTRSLDNWQAEPTLQKAMKISKSTSIFDA